MKFNLAVFSCINAHSHRFFWGKMREKDGKASFMRGNSGHVIVGRFNFAKSCGGLWGSPYINCTTLVFEFDVDMHNSQGLTLKFVEDNNGEWDVVTLEAGKGDTTNININGTGTGFEMSPSLTNYKYSFLNFEGDNGGGRYRFVFDALNNTFDIWEYIDGRHHPYLPGPNGADWYKLNANPITVKDAEYKQAHHTNRVKFMQNTGAGQAYTHYDYIRFYGIDENSAEHDIWNDDFDNGYVNLNDWVLGGTLDGTQATFSTVKDGKASLMRGNIECGHASEFNFAKDFDDFGNTDYDKFALEFEVDMYNFQGLTVKFLEKTTDWYDPYNNIGAQIATLDAGRGYIAYTYINEDWGSTFPLAGNLGGSKNTFLNYNESNLLGGGRYKFTFDTSNDGSFDVWEYIDGRQHPYLLPPDGEGWYKLNETPFPLRYTEPAKTIRDINRIIFRENSGGGTAYTNYDYTKFSGIDTEEVEHVLWEDNFNDPAKLNLQDYGYDFQDNPKTFTTSSNGKIRYVGNADRTIGRSFDISTVAPGEMMVIEFDYTRYTGWENHAYPSDKFLRLFSDGTEVLALQNDSQANSNFSSIKEVGNFGVENSIYADAHVEPGTGTNFWPYDPYLQNTRTYKLLIDTDTYEYTLYTKLKDENSFFKLTNIPTMTYKLRGEKLPNSFETSLRQYLGTAYVEFDNFKAYTIGKDEYISSPTIQKITGETLTADEANDAKIRLMSAVKARSEAVFGLALSAALLGHNNRTADDIF